MFYTNAQEPRVHDVIYAWTYIYATSLKQIATCEVFILRFFFLKFTPLLDHDKLQS